MSSGHCDWLTVREEHHLEGQLTLCKWSSVKRHLTLLHSILPSGQGLLTWTNECSYWKTCFTKGQANWVTCILLSDTRKGFVKREQRQQPQQRLSQNNASVTAKLMFNCFVTKLTNFVNFDLWQMWSICQKTEF